MARVLVVDDDSLFREAVRVMLTAAGHEVAEASNGYEAIESYRKSAAAVVLCDIFMTGKEGFETIRDLRQEFPTSKLVAMSVGDARLRMDVFKIAMHMGASATIRKPFDPEQLREVLDRVLVTTRD